MTPGSGEPTAPAGTVRPEPDELDVRVRSLRAERQRETPEGPPRIRPRRLHMSPEVAADMQRLIGTLVSLYTTPPDRETP